QRAEQLPMHACLETRVPLLVLSQQCAGNISWGSWTTHLSHGNRNTVACKASDGKAHRNVGGRRYERRDENADLIPPRSAGREPAEENIGRIDIEKHSRRGDRAIERLRSVAGCARGYRGNHGTETRREERHSRPAIRRV